MPLPFKADSKALDVGEKGGGGRGGEQLPELIEGGVLEGLSGRIMLS